MRPNGRHTAGASQLSALRVWAMGLLLLSAVAISPTAAKAAPSQAAVATTHVYLLRGVPDMPSAPYDLRRQQAEAEEQLLAALRSRIAQVPPGSETARQGLVLLGNAERSRGRAEAAVEAWNRAIAIRFDPQLAADLAELLAEQGSYDEASALLTRALRESPNDLRLRFLTGLVEEQAGRPANARSVWQALVDEAPPDAPWRAMMQRRIQRLP